MSTQSLVFTALRSACTRRRGQFKDLFSTKNEIVLQLCHLAQHRNTTADLIYALLQCLEGGFWALIIFSGLSK